MPLYNNLLNKIAFAYVDPLKCVTLKFYSQILDEAENNSYGQTL
jgi:hypothetical protein